MGTNFYTLDGRHIGKRSAAGRYCWDCRVTLCKGRIHYSEGFYDACPKCGAVPLKETIEASSAGRELGFNKSAPAAKTGVRSCSSFSWAMEIGEMEGEATVEDEYGRKYTAVEFQQVLEECPIRFTDSIGVEFS